MVASIKHTLIALVEDKPGVLNRAASLFRRRGFNIESIAVGHSELAGLSRMTLVVDGANIDLNEFVRKMLSGTLIGALSSLSGVNQDWKEIELNIKR